ncbi:IS30 family transposase [Lentibacillus sp. CBA3610]|uniref:IS30 family transposase n=1 Tax=Lentibacillus sp. CBA3610 TaxID=2518176 RepID=UPI0015958EC8|nr:IS30 family transposase [Lentibacillus sp. CBA3610]QKY70420.1 IS30 family transposase [Lentibacillus sp. CBA3610]
MTQPYSNTEERTFTHLTEMERGQIAAYLDEGVSLREIGRRMGRDASTISREKNRGSVQQIDTNCKTYTTYYPDAGVRVYEENRENCCGHSTMAAARDFIEFAEEKILGDEWSPDVIVGYANRQKQFDYVPSTKTLYNWIDEGKLSVINMDLELKLRRSTKKTKPRKNKKLLGTSIEERPESIDNREEFTHHPTTNYRFDNLGKMENFDKFKTFVIDLHKDILHHDFVSWDIAVGIDGQPIFIEANFAGATCLYQLAAQRPLFGDLTEEIIQYVANEIKKNEYRDVHSKYAQIKDKNKLLRERNKRLIRNNKNLKAKNTELEANLTNQKK